MTFSKIKISFIAIIIAFFTMGAIETVGPSLVTDLSKKIISINVNFTGSKFHIFGAIKKGINRDGPLDQPPFDIIIEVIGPSNELEVYKKDQHYGLWLNTQQQAFTSVPSFYSISGTRSIRAALTPIEQSKAEIGFSQLLKYKEGNQKTADFIEAILRISKKNSSYQTDLNPITLAENTLFSTEIQLPINLTEGNYKIRIHLLRFGEILSTKEDVIFVRKVGLEQWLYSLAHTNPFFYGIIALILAVSFGWVASRISRSFKS